VPNAAAPNVAPVVPTLGFAKCALSNRSNTSIRISNDRLPSAVRFAAENSVSKTLGPRASPGRYVPNRYCAGSKQLVSNHLSTVPIVLMLLHVMLGQLEPPRLFSCELATLMSNGSPP